MCVYIDIHIYIYIYTYISLALSLTLYLSLGREKLVEVGGPLVMALPVTLTPSRSL